MSSKIGRFEIVSEFTHSDLISVYKASDSESGQTVALKAIPLAALGEQAAPIVQSVLEEAEASKSLNSHNITALSGVSEVDGHLCASMEYVQGNSIATMLARKEGFSIWDLQDIARQACQGLDHARVHKVVHHSLEPAKIMVQWDGIVKILSYGVSRMSSDAAQAAGRATTVFHYMSPEQLRGEAIDPRSNIFSLGAILYEMMTERKAFEGENIDQIRQAILETMPTAVHLVNRKIHSGLSAVIMKALAKAPEERYESGQDLINDLEKCKENPAKTTLGAKPAPSLAKPPAPTPAPKPPVQPAAFKAAAAASSPAFTHAAKTPPSPAEFMNRAPESVSEPAAQMSVAAAEPEVTAPKINVDPMMDEGHHPATKGPSFSDINELPPLKEVYVAPEPPPPAPVAEEPEPVEAVQAKAVVFKNAAPAKPKTPPSVVAKKAVAEIKKTPPKFFMYSVGGAIAVILLIVGGIAYHLHSSEDGEEDNTPNQIAQAPPAQQTPAPQATAPAEAQAPTPAPAQITPPPPAEETPAVSVTPKYQEKTSKKQKGKNRVPVAAPAIIPGQLSVDSNPAGAQVQLDGQPQNGVTPFSLAGLTPGQHTLTISKAGYTADTRTLNVTSGGRSSVSVQLIPVAASIAANSNPSGAEIWIDGKDTGRATPAQISVDKPGSHNFTFKKQGYLDENASANLQVGQVTQLSPTLRPLGSTDDIKFARKFGKFLGGSETAGMGTVSVRTTPKGAQIAVNNRIIDKMSPVEFYLNPGNYTIDITLSGFKDVHKVVTVEKNGKVAIDENLDRE